MLFNSNEHPHRRFNTLTGEWILISPHRTKLPWQGRVEKSAQENRPQYDPGCYFYPGNTHADGASNPRYKSTFVFENDFAALLPDTPSVEGSTDDLFLMQGIRGTSRVICFSPRHDLTLPEMALEDIEGVIKVCAEQTSELGEKYQWGQVFENKGSVMGSSNPHPHGQVWAQTVLPIKPALEDRHQRAHFDVHEMPLLIQ